jgi:hypothetical protein
MGRQISIVQNEKDVREFLEFIHSMGLKVCNEDRVEITFDNFYDKKLRKQSFSIYKDLNVEKYKREYVLSTEPYETTILESSSTDPTGWVKKKIVLGGGKEYDYFCASDYPIVQYGSCKIEKSNNKKTISSGRFWVDSSIKGQEMEKYYNKIIYWIKKNYVRIELYYYVSRNVINDVKANRVTLKDNYTEQEIKDFSCNLAVKDKKEKDKKRK